MKPNLSEFDSGINNELTSAQKAALESVLFGNQTPPAPQETFAQKEPYIPTESFGQQSLFTPQGSGNPNEPQVVTIDLTRKAAPANNQQPHQQLNRQQYGQQYGQQPDRQPVRQPARQPTRQPTRQRTRESREDTQIPSYDSYRPSGRKRAATHQRNPGVRRTTAKNRNIMMQVLIGAMGLVLLGVWVRCMMGTPAPEADMTDVTINIGESVAPMDFIKEIHSESEIASVEFVSEPDILAHTDQVVEIIITDENDKSTTLQAKLIIRINREKPTIEGTGTIMSTIGSPIIYRQDVYARDDFGRPLELQVDSSEVNQNEIGVYKIIFRATDLTGNTTEVTEEVHIVSIDVGYVLEQVDIVLADITNIEMTQLEKVRAIHAWIRANINYASVIGGPGTVFEDAHRAISERRGNCYVFYAIGDVMLTRAGIENRPIDRIPGTPTRHRWSLVNPDGLGWHHFDTTPTRLGLGAETAFFTDSQAKEFTNRFVEFNGTQNFYTYNPDLYPPIVQ